MCSRSKPRIFYADRFRRGNRGRVRSARVFFLLLPPAAASLDSPAYVTARIYPIFSRISLYIKHHRRRARPGFAALICRYLTVRRLPVTAGHKGGIVEVAWPRGRAARVTEGKEGCASVHRLSRGGVGRGKCRRVGESDRGARMGHTVKKAG